MMANVATWKTLAKLATWAVLALTVGITQLDAAAHLEAADRAIAEARPMAAARATAAGQAATAGQVTAVADEVVMRTMVAEMEAKDQARVKEGVQISTNSSGTQEPQITL
jgi:hypothetical protein